MHMSFWFGYDIKEFIFSTLNITSISGLVGTCIILFLLAASYECIKLGLAQVRLYSSSIRPKPPSCISEDTVLIQDVTALRRKRWAWFTFEMNLYLLEVLLGYILMLVVMSYNAYVLIIVVLGAGLGYALVGQKLLLIRLKTTKLKVPCQTCTAVPSRNVSRGSSCSNSITETTIETNCCSNRSLSPVTEPHSA